MMTRRAATEICLIIPPSVFLLDERVFMSLGILKVAAVLEQQGVTVHLLDLSGIENYTDAVRDFLQASDVVTFGITATTPQLPAATRVVEAIRSGRPGARVILGGPHITLVNTAARRERKAGAAGRAAANLARLAGTYDVLVAGDGEQAIFQALAPDSPGLIDADDPSSPLFLVNKTLDELPMPARHLVDVESYRYEIDGVPAISLIAQLGCPFACGFCGGRSSPMLRRVRMRSTESIVGEIAHLHRAYGHRGFMLYDDELNVNPRMPELMRGIARLQAELGVSFCLRGFIKAELFTDEQASAMYQAGFRWILTGFESGAPRILKNMNKHATREDNSRCIDIAHRHGLKVKALMSLGHPGDSPETLAQTRDWLLEARPDDFDLTIITTYPGTPYYDEAVQHPQVAGVWTYTFAPTGDRLHSFEVDYAVTANYYKGNPDGGYQSFVFSDHLSCDELVHARNALERQVRKSLGISFYALAAKQRYEHSMGQFGQGLPARILRSSSGPRPRAAR